MADIGNINKLMNLQRLSGIRVLFESFYKKLSNIALRYSPSLQKCSYKVVLVRIAAKASIRAKRDILVQFGQSVGRCLRVHPLRTALVI
jgi:hypothetical protein